ncbi:MAG: DNA gyrase inhibitor YacG [Thermodesulfobacteriota bacterium]
MIVKCPKCRESTTCQGNEWRPFCSRRCKLIDLGSWISEEYVIIEGSKPETIPKEKLRWKKNDNNEIR